MEFSKRIKKLREEKGLTVIGCARELNISPQRFRNWEYGGNLPSKNMIIKLADYFNVSERYLLCKSEYRNKSKENKNIKRIEQSSTLDAELNNLKKRCEENLQAINEMYIQLLNDTISEIGDLMNGCVSA